MTDPGITLQDIRRTRTALEARARQGDLEATLMLDRHVLDTMIAGAVVVNQSEILATGDDSVEALEHFRTEHEGVAGPIASTREHWDGIGLYVAPATARLLEAVEQLGLGGHVWRVLDDGTVDLW